MRLCCSLAFLFFLAVPGARAAGEPCTDCAPDTEDAVTANWLAWEGYDPQAYSLMLTWEERAPLSGEMVTGYHLRAVDCGNTVDVYRDASWKRLEEGVLAELGVPPKQWAGLPVEKSPEVTPTLPKAGHELSAFPAAALNTPPARQCSLPPLNLEAVLREDAAFAASEQKGPLRYGVRRDLTTPLRLQGPADMPSAWSLSEAGHYLATFQISAPGAVGLRVRAEVNALPEGSRLFLYDAGDPTERYGPFRPRGTWWSPSCFGDSVILVVETEDPAATVELAVPEVAQLYRSLDTLPYAKAAGSCNLNVACYPAWASSALAVGGLGKVGLSGVLFCTGSLVVDSDPDTHIPYFITANHCVSSESEANSVEVYWLFQSPACDADPPDPATVPRTTGGADLLVTSPTLTGSDFTLLQLREDPPGGLVALGFSTAIPAVDTPVTCIHHPSRSYKRISFGNLLASSDFTLDVDPPQNEVRYYHEILWSDGTTEPGSSGSPLLLGDQQLFIGQLYGGGAACTRPLEPDYYGRFDISFPMAESYLHSSLSPFDVDLSGAVNAVDLQLTIQAVLNGAKNLRADVDYSGAIDARDLQQLTQAIMRGGNAS